MARLLCTISLDPTTGMYRADWPNYNSESSPTFLGLLEQMKEHIIEQGVQEWSLAPRKQVDVP